MQPKPIADTVNTAFPLPNVLCVRTAAILTGKTVADTGDLPVMDFPLPLLFQYWCDTDCRTCQYRPFQETATAHLCVVYTVLLLFISYLFNCQLYVCKNTVLNLSARYQYHGIKDQFYRSTYNICEMVISSMILIHSVLHLYATFADK